MRIAVFGIGYVGAVSAACLATSGHSVVAVDTNPDKVACLNAGLSPIVEPGLDELIGTAVASGRLRATSDPVAAVTGAELSLVCVGTPSRPNGNLDLSLVIRVAEQIGAALPGTHGFHAVVVRSTMLPGSTTGIVVPTLERASGKRAGEDFGVAVCPEFLREGSAIRDYHETPLCLAGVLEQRTLKMIEALAVGLPTVLVRTEPVTAEMLKYANNAWHAVKIVFANEIGAIAKAVGADGREVMDLLCADRRLNVSPVYLRPGFAFGGSCLPKDLRALLYQARQSDVDCPLLEGTPVSNDQQIRRAFDMVCAAGHRRVSLIGLSFKSGTDDMRESPAVELAEQLFGKGYDLRIFDRNVSLARLTGTNRSFIEGRIPHLAMLLSDDLGDVVRHGQTLVVAHHAPADGAFPPLRPDQVVIDLGGGAPTALTAHQTTSARRSDSLLSLQSLWCADAA
jgi:GDP-mannose 6-dehydrogenase